MQCLTNLGLVWEFFRVVSTRHGELGGVNTMKESLGGVSNIEGLLSDTLSSVSIALPSLTSS